jgi:hypothetical protein
MAMVGHRAESIYRCYAIVSEGDLKAGAEKLAALHAALAAAPRTIVGLGSYPAAKRDSSGTIGARRLVKEVAKYARGLVGSPRIELGTPGFSAPTRPPDDRHDRDGQEQNQEVPEEPPSPAGSVASRSPDTSRTVACA